MCRVQMEIFLAIVIYLVFPSTISGKIIKLHHEGDYDTLIFTQSWPPTNCFVWEEKSPSNQCNLPPNEEWSIHGIWPNKNHTLGPFFCNRTMHFDLGALASLRQQLEVKWIDVHKGTKPHEFWKHEWDKHGTCAMDIPSINSEVKYFKKGLEWFDTYDMKNILAKENILPNHKYFLHEYLDAVKRVLNIDAFVECQKHPKTGEQFISELRICFNKNLTLAGCNGIVSFPSNCKDDVEIIYPSIPPPLQNHPTVIHIK